ncbi:MAG: response regulator, partial [Gammaproteobacteria bacterium]
MIVVADSGPLIHLAGVKQFSLLKRFFHTLHTIPQVYEEVVTQGQGRAGDFEMRQALQERWLLVDAAADPALVQRFIAANVSETDAAVIASAIMRKAALLLADDMVVNTYSGLAPRRSSITDLATRFSTTNRSRRFLTANADRMNTEVPGMNGSKLVREAKRDPALATTRFVMLTSIRNLEETARLVTSGIDSYLNKPVRQSDLYNCLVNLLERSGRWDGIISARKPDEVDVTLKGRVLVAEDNPVNQQLAQLMLEAVGVSVDLAENGRAAVLAVSRAMERGQPYDLVLMDCQMPAMDGFEATAALRAKEITLPRVPIIALTANALEGDRERCLAAGMDDYIAKPFTQKEIAACLSRWLPDKSEQVRKSEIEQPDKPALEETAVGEPAVVRLDQHPCQAYEKQA